MSLSDKRKKLILKYSEVIPGEFSRELFLQDKEFIKRLKERDFKLDLEQLRKLDKLIGEDLI